MITVLAPYVTLFTFMEGLTGLEFSDVYMFTIRMERGTWSCIGTDIPGRPGAATIAAVPGRLLILGGIKMSVPLQRRDRLRVFCVKKKRCLRIDLQSQKLNCSSVDIVLRNAPPSVYCHSMVMAESKLLVFGGFGLDGSHYMEVIPESAIEG